MAYQRKRKSDHIPPANSHSFHDRPSGVQRPGGTSFWGLPQMVAWIRQTPDIGTATQTVRPGACVMIVSWILRNGCGKQVARELAVRMGCSELRASGIVTEGCYRAGWLSQALFAQESMRFTSEARTARREPADRPLCTESSSPLSERSPSAPASPPEEG
jgi:hypothetical protein